ncbi:branched-chain amino acid ABC transporter permease [Roseiarcaceae bacterium H3SJ34-1]|uniref:branched-chain amino acid ABC transporter permease n=1 Tax=Terripilifer ovatus TaxID=3032367 RepID=UPI003AB93162|nr:branched-chain amino acid ABC transporter permease [Roseiarcaceae bacterium H3SJ34-1]
MLDLLPQFVFNGLLIGMSYALVAIGMTMIFGIMNIANFAHGEFYMLGGCITYFIAAKLNAPYLVAVPVSVAVVTGLGFLLERVVFRQLRLKSAMSSVLATIGLGLILQNGALIFFGPQPQAIPTSFSAFPLQLGPIFTTEARLFAVAVTAATLVLMYVFLNHTLYGTAMRATFQQTEAAALVAIPIDRMRGITFALGAGLAALGGALLGAIFFVQPAMGATESLKAFIVVILGGLGSIPGSIVGGIFLGVAESLGTVVSSAYKDAIGFVLVIIIMLYRPDGLFKKS